VVDRSSFPRDKPCAEYLSPAAEPLLGELGIADLLDAAHPNLEGARRAGAEVREGWRAGQVERVTGGYRLHPVGTHEPIEARLLVAADGVHSTIARRLGLQRTSRMRKIALVAHMRGISGLTSYGEMHVAGRRYVGIAPLEPCDRGDLCNVAMVIDEKRDGPHLAGKPDEFLLAALRTFPALRDRLGYLTVERRTLTISRLRMHARRLSDAHLLLAGDATGYYDPFTGEGIYRALYGARLLAAIALPALNLGDLTAARLAAYDRQYHSAFRGKRLIEWIIQTAVQAPPLMEHIARTLGRRKAMADTIIAVTGDFLPSSTVLRPGYLLRLVL
jgi:flavin-dependent dehydrogenase